MLHDNSITDINQFNDQGISVQAPELRLDIDDITLNQIIEDKISTTQGHYNKSNLNSRRSTNENFWLGKQIDETKLHQFQIPSVDNIIWQNTEQRISIASGRMPDIIVTPGNKTDPAKEVARKLENILDMDLGSRKTKRLIKNGLRHNHLYFIAAAKAVWDPKVGEGGDYRFELIRPSKLLIDHTANIPDDGFTADNTGFIAEKVEEPLSLMLAKFPSKRREILAQVGASEFDGKRLASNITYQEVWFTTYDKQGQRLEGVLWRLNNLILDKMRNPYFDWKGYNRPVVGEDGQPFRNPLTNQPIQESVFRNFFEIPRKPYILFSYQNLGLGPMDDTTAVEQGIMPQRMLNKRERQITEIADNVTNKFAFNNLIDKDEARRITSDPTESIWINTSEDIRSAVMSFSTAGPPAVLYQDAQVLRQQLDSKFNTHGTTRGETNVAESGISKQISREGDLVASDDIVDIVIERVVEEMAAWSIQLIKLFYAEQHFKSKLGTDGELVQEAVQRDEIEDGVAVTVRAGVADKQTAKAEIQNLAQAGSADPLTLFEEMDVPNPKERTNRLLDFITGEADGFARYKETAKLVPEGEGQQQPQQQPQPQPGIPAQQPIQPGAPAQPQIPPELLGGL